MSVVYNEGPSSEKLSEEAHKVAVQQISLRIWETDKEKK